MDVDVDLVFLPAVTSIDARLRRRIFASLDDAKSFGASNPVHCTQCLARVGLWGRRQKYYDRYVDLSSRGLESDIVIPNDDKPYTWNRPGAITVRSYEDEVAYLTISQAAAAVRRFLRDYMAVSLHEVEIPEFLYSAFASSRYERYYPLGNSPDLLMGLISKSTSSSLRTARAQDIANASRRRVRDFSPFESQVLALKRLSDQGEPELALVGLMALVEWLLKEKLPKELQKENKRQNNIWHVFKQSRKYFSAPDGVWSTIEYAIEHRNFHVHEKPVNRSQSYNPANSRSTNAEATDLFNETAVAAFEVFKATNRAHNLNSE